MNQEEFLNILPKDTYKLAIKYKINNSWFIAVINNLSYAEKYGVMIRISHPMNLKTKYILCGAGFYKLSEFSEKITVLKSPSEHELEIWKKNYLEFHDNIVSDKGYDSCSENLSFVKLWPEVEEK